MHISNFDFHLPDDLIAQHPARKRDSSRLLHLTRHDEYWVDRTFHDFPKLLRHGDLLVLNNTLVYPARLFGNLIGNNKKVELLLIEQEDVNVWKVLVKPGRLMSLGTRVVFGDGQLKGTVTGNWERGRIIQFDYSNDFNALIDKIGYVPLPPYIKRPKKEDYSKDDEERYQTVYASERGSIAAPTAGLHLTNEILEQIADKGVEIEEITLHVGYATFQPVEVQEIEDHWIPSEYYFVSAMTAQTIQDAIRQGRRIVAVGTTTTRTLETVVDDNGNVNSGYGQTKLFIHPGYNFKAVGALLTNFHLPRSSLLMLVAAFAGHELVMRAYKHAIEKKYRFYSFGDAMFIE